VSALVLDPLADFVLSSAPVLAIPENASAQSALYPVDGWVTVTMFPPASAITL